MTRQKARRCWTKPAGAHDSIREKDGERLSFTIINRSSRPERTAIAQAIQATMLKEGRR